MRHLRIRLAGSALRERRVTTNPLTRLDAERSALAISRYRRPAAAVPPRRCRRPWMRSWLVPDDARRRRRTPIAAPDVGSEGSDISCPTVGRNRCLEFLWRAADTIALVSVIVTGAVAIIAIGGQVFISSRQRREERRRQRYEELAATYREIGAALEGFVWSIILETTGQPIDVEPESTKGYQLLNLHGASKNVLKAFLNVTRQCAAMHGQPAENLAPLYGPSGPLVDAYSIAGFNIGNRLGSFQNCSITNRLDYIFVSQALAGLVTGGGLERHGLWGTSNEQEPASDRHVLGDLRRPGRSRRRRVRSRRDLRRHQHLV